MNENKHTYPGSSLWRLQHLLLLFLAVLLLTVGGCWRDSLPGKRQLKLSFHSASQADGDAIREIELFVFDDQLQLTNRATGTIGETVTLDCSSIRSLQCIAWGNSNDKSLKLPALQPGDPLDGAYIALTPLSSAKTETQYLNTPPRPVPGSHRNRQQNDCPRVFLHDGDAARYGVDTYNDQRTAQSHRHDRRRLHRRGEPHSRPHRLRRNHRRLCHPPGYRFLQLPERIHHPILPCLPTARWQRDKGRRLSQRDAAERTYADKYPAPPRPRDRPGAEADDRLQCRRQRRGKTARLDTERRRCNLPVRIEDLKT